MRFLIILLVSFLGAAKAFGVAHRGVSASKKLIVRRPGTKTGDVFEASRQAAAAAAQEAGEDLAEALFLALDADASGAISLQVLFRGYSRL